VHVEIIWYLKMELICKQPISPRDSRKPYLATNYTRCIMYVQGRKIRIVYLGIGYGNAWRSKGMRQTTSNTMGRDSSPEFSVSDWSSEIEQRDECCSSLSTLSLIGTVGNLGRTVSTTFSEQCSSVDVHRSRMIEPTADVAEFIGRFPASVAMPLTAQLGIPRRRF